MLVSGNYEQRKKAYDGTIAARTCDAMLAGEMPDFGKIDVEGMEMAVLAGLSSQWRSTIPTTPLSSPGWPALASA